MISPVIDINDLSKSYGGDRGIVHISLRVEEGEIFGFIGPNGAGKSTTIRILLNLIFPSGGTAKIMGMDVVSESKKIKFQTGYVPSDANAYSQMTVDEFLNYCQGFYRTGNGSERIAELSELFEVDRKRKISDLSRGNRKKVAIVQSLIHNPRLLILDEPTTGLDPLMQIRFYDLLRTENRKGMTIFFSSHTLSEVQLLCKRVAIIRDGAIIKVEDIDTLRRRQLKKIRIEFEEQVEKEIMTLHGIEPGPVVSGKAFQCLYSGSIEDLISALRGKKITDMTIEEPSLEEIFMHYYN
jgi:ABC-2 type transport system ATP-binding protein